MQEVLDLVRSVLRSIWTHRWWGVFAAMIVGVAGSVWVFTVAEQYEARARVFADTQSILKPLMSGLTVQLNIDQQLIMMSRTLISRPNIEKVVRMTDMDLQARTPKERDVLVDDVMKRLQFSGGNDNLYQIAYRGPDQQQARKVVQAFLSLFVEANLGDKRRDTDQAIRFLDEQIKVYEQRLVESENRLKEFRIKNILTTPGIGSDTVSRTSDAQNQLAQAKMELSQAQNARDEFRKQLAVEPEQVASDRPIFELQSAGSAVATARRSQYDDRIDTQRRRLDELRLRFTDRHPDVVATERIIRELEASREAEFKAIDAKADAKGTGKGPEKASGGRGSGMVPNPVYQQLKVSLAEAEATVASLTARVREYDTRLLRAKEAATMGPKIEAEYQQLNRDYEVTKRNYDQLVTRRDAAVMSGELDAKSSVADFRVIDPPRVSPKAVFPNRPMLLGGVLGASLLFGLAVAFLRDQIRPTILDLRTLRNLTGLPLLGAVSLIPDAGTLRRARRDAIAFAGVSAAYLSVFLIVLAWASLRQSGSI